MSIDDATSQKSDGGPDPVQASGTGKVTNAEAETQFGDKEVKKLQLEKLEEEHRITDEEDVLSARQWADETRRMCESWIESQKTGAERRSEEIYNMQQGMEDEAAERKKWTENMAKEVQQGEERRHRAEERWKAEDALHDAKLREEWKKIEEEKVGTGVSTRPSEGAAKAEYDRDQELLFQRECGRIQGAKERGRVEDERESEIAEWDRRDSLKAANMRRRDAAEEEERAAERRWKHMNEEEKQEMIRGWRRKAREMDLEDE
jgi:hypothetical protein